VESQKKWIEDLQAQIARLSVGPADDKETT
jgi:hypothetical protein